MNRPSGGGKDLIIIAIVGLVLIAAFIFILFKIIGQSEQHVEKVRKTKMKYEESLNWRPDSKIVEERILEDLNVNPRRKKASYKQTELSRKSFKYLGRMVALEELNLSACTLRDKWLKYIQDLHLVGLNLCGTNLTDRGTKYIAKIKTLRFLDLSETEITDEGFKTIASLKNLNSLSFDRTKITDDSIKFILPMKRLRFLNICYTKITPDGINELTKLKNLHAINVHGLKISKENVENIAALPKLDFFTANDCSLKDDDIVPLSKCKSLKRVKLDSNEITDKCFKTLEQLPELRFLSMEHCPGITSDAAKEFQESHPDCRVRWTYAELISPDNIPIGDLKEEVKFIEDQVKQKRRKK